MPDEDQLSLRFEIATKSQERALRVLANAPNPQEGASLKLSTGMALVRRGWAIRGTRYPLFRITGAGRRTLYAAHR
jgi:hypothetical protein